MQAVAPVAAVKRIGTVSSGDAVVAVASTQPVGGDIAQDDVCRGIADAADGAAGQHQVFLIAAEGPADGAAHLIGAAVKVIPDQQVAAAVDDIDVVAGAAVIAVRAGPAIQQVVAVVALQAVIAAAAIEAVVAGIAHQHIVAVLAQQHVAGVGGIGIVAAAQQPVVARAAAQHVGAVAAFKRVGPGQAQDEVCPCIAIKIVPARTATERVVAGIAMCGVVIGDGIADAALQIDKDQVIAVIAMQPVGIDAADQRVVACAAVNLVAPGLPIDQVIAGIAVKQVRGSVVAGLPAGLIRAAIAIDDVIAIATIDLIAFAIVVAVVIDVAHDGVASTIAAQGAICVGGVDVAVIVVAAIAQHQCGAPQQVIACRASDIAVWISGHDPLSNPKGRAAPARRVRDARCTKPAMPAGFLQWFAKSGLIGRRQLWLTGRAAPVSSSATKVKVASVTCWLSSLSRWRRQASTWICIELRPMRTTRA